MDSCDFMKIMMKPNKAAKPADGHPALDVNYGSTEDYMMDAVKRYDKARTEYLQSAGDDPRLIRKSEKWQRSAYSLASWANAWFVIYNGNREEQEKALSILDRVSKDSGIRKKNITHQIERLEKQNDSEINENELQKLERAEEHADNFLRQCLMNQQKFNELFEKGPDAVSIETIYERRAGRQFVRLVDKIPEGKLFRKASVFPIHPVPAGERVPMPPKVLDDVFYTEPENLVWDDTIDELVIKPGYVSPDGRIDDKSVIWHPENNTVEVGYVGEKKELWAYWKPQNEGDLPPIGSWVEEYRDRGYRQCQEDAKLGLLKPKSEDFE